jgi:hypothetical protein
MPQPRAEAVSYQPSALSFLNPLTARWRDAVLAVQEGLHANADC